VLCHPLGHEYIRVHRAFRNLAADLSDAGCHVLRFDYHGTGDSSGDAAETRVARCIEDVNVAIDELKDMCGASRVSLVGLRIGATLAAVVSAARRDIDSLVAWDPVCRGVDYLAKMRLLHQGWLRNRPWMNNGPEAARDEMMGFPVCADFERELGQLDIATLGQCRARRACLVLSGDVAQNTEAKDWRERINTGSGHDLSVELPNLRKDWDDAIMAHRTLLAREAIDVVREILTDAKAPLVPGSARRFTSADH
jgi:pimeloyl-ACP methyl ester carboxylesterase